MKLSEFTTLTFDCYGTLIDWESGIANVLTPWAGRNGVAAGREALLEAFGRHETEVEREAPGTLYPNVLRETHRRIAREFGVEPRQEDADMLGNSVRHWPAFPDSSIALTYLKRHYRLVILSNIDIASFAHSNRKLGVEFDAVYTAEDIGSYKPDLRNFRYMLDRLAKLGVTAEQILHTAQSPYHDIPPAKELGLATCWINRRHDKEGTGATRVGGDTAADFTFSSLGDLAAAHRAEAGE